MLTFKSCRRFRLWSRLALLSVAVCGLAGCTSITLAIANAPAAFGDYRAEHGIEYGTGKAQRLDVYSPPEVSEPRAVVVFFHGGGWTSGSRGQYRFVAEALSAQGYVAVIPGYRLFPEARFPEFVEDAAHAVAWTRAHIAEFGGDPQRIFLMGHSAGGHIAAMLTYDERFLRAAGVEPASIAGFIGLAGAYDFLPFQWDYLADVFGPPQRYPDSQPINFVDGAEPPTFLLHGLADTVVSSSNSKHLAAKIRTQGGEVQERYYEGMSHGGVLATMSVYLRKKRTVLQEIDEFIAATTRAADTRSAAAHAR